MSPKQKSLLLSQSQGDFAIHDTDIPVPSAGDLLVRIEAAGLNPVDWMIHVMGDAAVPVEYPAVLGSDGAGVVEQVGEGVANFAVGDRVLFQSPYDRRHATFQQYCVVTAALAAKIPSNLSFELAATVPLGSFTATVCLYNPKQPVGGGAGLLAPWKEGGRNKYAGQPIVVIGGASCVGQYAIQFARLSGFSPIIATASPRNEDYVRAAGATHFVDRNAPLQEAVLQILGSPPKTVFDAIGAAATQLIGYELVASGGQLIDSLPCVLDPGKLKDDKEYVFVNAGSYFPHARELGLSTFSNISALLESGDIKPNRLEVLSGGLDGVAAGLERLKNGQVSGKKLVARSHDTK